MLCPKCSKEIPPAFTLCPFCAQTALNGDPLSHVAVQSMPVSPAVSPAAGALISICVAIGAALLVGMAYLKTRMWSHGNFTPVARGYFLGSLVTPLLLSWLIVWLITRKRNPPMATAKKLGVGVSIAVVWSFLALVGVASSYRSQSEEDISQRIAKLAREGTGRAPKSENKDEYDDILRSLFADIKKFNDDYNADLAAADNSQLKQLYTANSFRNGATISLMLTQLHTTLAVDEKYASLAPVIQKTKDRLAASSMSEDSKAAFLKGFEGSLGTSLQTRNEVIAKERTWLQDSIALYEFMKENGKSYYVKNDKILFKSDDPMNEYNEKIKKVEEERKDFLATQRKFEQTQREELGKVGLKPSDFDTPGQK
jgi:hypothetical protein